MSPNSALGANSSKTALVTYYIDEQIIVYAKLAAHSSHIELF